MRQRVYSLTLSWREGTYCVFVTTVNVKMQMFWFTPNFSAFSGPFHMKQTLPQSAKSSLSAHMNLRHVIF